MRSTMAKQSKTQQLADGIAGQHLALSVAAHLARTQLIADPARVYDGQHLGEMLNVVAVGLARTAPLYVFDPACGQPRQLTPEELEGAVAKRSAAQLVLKNGRTLSGVSIRRADLRQAIAVLKVTGLPQAASKPPVAAPKPKPQMDNGPGGLLARLAEIERWLTPPLLPTQVEKANSHALFIARRAPQGRVANLAMQLMSALHGSRGTEDIPGSYRMALARLRAALEETASSS
jgi:hypothetical protein